jgi:hypothetical protein
VARVTLANGRTADVTATNWNDLAAEQIAFKDANGGLSFQEKGATLNAFRQLAGLGNGFYTATATGAAVESSSDSVFKLPFVSLTDKLTGKAPVGAETQTTLLDDVRNSAAELAGNARDLAAAAGDKLGGGTGLMLVVAAVAAGGLVLYVATR